MKKRFQDQEIVTLDVSETSFVSKAQLRYDI